MPINRVTRGGGPHATTPARSARPSLVFGVDATPRASTGVTHAVVEDRETYVSRALEAATAHLHGTISVEDHSFITGYLREVIETDPALADLVERVTHRAA